MKVRDYSALKTMISYKINESGNAEKLMETLRDSEHWTKEFLINGVVEI